MLILTGHFGELVKNNPDFYKLLCADRSSQVGKQGLKVASQDAIRSGIALLLWKLQRPLVDILQGGYSGIVKPFVASLFSRCHCLLLLAFFTHTLNCNNSLQRLIPGHAISPHIVVVVRALWTTGQQIKAMTMPTCATQYALTRGTAW